MTTATRPDTPANLMIAFAERAAAGDVERLMELYHPEGVFQPQFGVQLHGHDQIRPAITEFVQLQPQITYDGTPEVIITGRYALVSNTWSMTATAPDGTTIGERGVSADVLEQQADGSWLVLIDQPRGEVDPS